MSKSLSLTEQLAKHLMRPVDDATRERSRLHLLDWLGCVAGALRSERSSQPKQVVHRYTFSSLLGSVLEMDDVHRTSLLHPGPVIWPTVCAQGWGSDLDRLLDSAVRGYEAMIAVGATLDAHHYSFYHPTSTAGVFGAAACFGSGFLDCDQQAHALALAGSVSGGFWQTRHSQNWAKQWHAEHARDTGSKVAILAHDGVTGPLDVLEGRQGLYAATCKKPKPMEFPKRWRIWDVSFKPWGACRHAHPAIDAALELQALLGKLDGEIVVETYADAVAFCDNPNPKTSQQAKFSLQHAVAIVAERGVPQLADFEPAAVRKLARARARVTARECKDISARYPQHFGARVTCNNQVVEMIDTLGDPERPMSETQIIDKARALMAWGGLSDKQASKAVKLALEVDDPQAIHKMLGKWLV
jgi:2-methylcitrate dehydratase PrpD